MLDLSLRGRVAIVTGASKGIGRAVALALADAGADVALAARGAEDLERTAGEVRQAGVRALAVPTDVSVAESVQDLVDATVRDLGTVDILVNNAGAAPFMSSVEQIRESGFEKYFRINFMGAVYATRAVGPVLLAKRGGCVLNVASVAGFIASPGLSYYSTAKAALINLTKTVAREWAPAGVRVNAIAPGWIETDMNAGARGIPEFYQGALASIPLGRWGRPEDLTGLVVFLCSDAASWMTGTTVVVDGGQTTTALTNP
jgi:NAD(P)-dependent dehydrogenase (short-subunit alcohol dehydrogenase family)